MKISLGKALTVAVAATLLLAIPALAGDQDFTLHNNTSKTLKSLYVSPHSSDDWGDDVLGDDEVEPGKSVHITFPRSEDKCHWDVKGDFEGGGSAEVDDVDFCSVSEVNFHD